MNAAKTRQDVLREAYAHFSKPGASLAWDGGSAQCVYRLGNDPASPVRCAFGAVIPDDRYDYRFEGRYADDVIEGFKRHPDGGGEEWELVPGIRDVFADDVTGQWANEFQQLHDVIAESDAGIDQLLKELVAFAANDGIVLA